MASQLIRHILINYSALNKLQYTIWSSKDPSGGISTNMIVFLTNRKHMYKIT